MIKDNFQNSKTILIIVFERRAFGFSLDTFPIMRIEREYTVTHINKHENVFRGFDKRGNCHIYDIFEKRVNFQFSMHKG